ncbi:MAG: HlyD family efflux transporter periplasmic adaptor subunit [Candidatus Eremiobacteraeota bacterium]|nr:HlyD family efflux transporter periplasmic adaptor subunit [Candidatus Eremiobacteraeota bacterium]
MKARYIPAVIFIFLFIIAGIIYLEYLATPRMPEGFVFASGTIEGIEYQASTRISGKVTEVKVEEGDIVKKGDLLVVLKSDQFEAAVERAEANLALCKSKLVQAEIRYREADKRSGSVIEQASAGISASSAGIGQAEALYRQAVAHVAQAEALEKQTRARYEQKKRDYERYKNLFSAGAISRSELDSIEVSYISALEDYKISARQVDSAREAEKAALNALKTARAQNRQSIAALENARITTLTASISKEDIDVARAMLKEAKAALSSARADFADSRIYSPTDGRVVYKLVGPGEVIAPGSPLITIVDLDSLYLKVFIPNEQAGKLKVGNPVRLYPDAYPKKVFKAEVERIAQEAEFIPKNVATRQQRVQMVFEVRLRVKENHGGDLKPGMPAEALIQYDPDADWEKAEKMREKAL